MPLSSAHDHRPQRARLSPLADLKAVEVFVSVIETQSLTKAARRLGIGVSTVSKKLSELEARAEARLLNRTTRKLYVTEMGKRLYERCLKITDEIEKAETELWEQSRAPNGRLRIAAPVVLGRTQIAPLLTPFLRRYPDIRVELALSPRTADLIEEGIDVAIRLVRSDQVEHGMQRICPNRRVFCASPGYLREHGEPAHPDALSGHACLVALTNEAFDRWPYVRGRSVGSVRVSGPLVSDNVDVLRQAAIDGLGVAYLGLSLVAPDLQAGRLRQVLNGHAVQDSLIVALVPHVDFVPQRAAVFIAFLRERFGNTAPWEEQA